MIKKFFSVRDNAAQAFLLPFEALTKGMAIRMFSDAVNDEKGTFIRHREDFSLWYLGEFDDGKGEFLPLAQPEKVMLAIEVATPEFPSIFGSGPASS